MTATSGLGGELTVTVVLAADGRPHKVKTNRGSVRTTLSVGRGADVAVNDPRISRYHFSVQRIEDGGFQLIDLGSRNGTFLNGRRVRRAQIEGADVIRAGDSVFVFDEAPRGGGALPWGRVVGASRALERIVEQAADVTTSHDGVVLEGERGVGRRLVAAEIALRARLAEGEWRFIPDVCDWSPNDQAQLSRDLREAEKRLFTSAAQSLDAEVAAGRLDAALRALLPRRRIVIPALRARRLDILPLAKHLLEGALGKPPPQATVDFVEPLLVHDWPGNVRELRDLMEVVASRVEGRDLLTGELLPDSFHERVGLPEESEGDDSSAESDVETEVAPSERELRAQLERHRGNVSEVARVFRKDRVQLYRWLKRYNLKVEDFRSG